MIHFPAFGVKTRYHMTVSCTDSITTLIDGPHCVPSRSQPTVRSNRETPRTMPGLVQNRRKRPSTVLSSENESEDSDHSSLGSKRARHARNASRNPLPTSGHHRHDGASDIPVEDEFQPGTLVRVKLKNFVTYTAAEFHLGPSLNMVIGPNGTGKSTLVCAICLGLGWSSEHLGRAKDLNLFVKNGSEQAEIEIELAAGPGMRTNPIVRRLIRRSDGKSVFWINDKQASKSAVLSLCKEFSIQIDNLCQFLPQDRVVEFAKMSDVDRLRETQRAAAPKHMVEWHDQLRELRSEEKGLETEQQAEKRHLEGLEKQQDADRDDVERFQQREGLLQKSRCLAKVKPIIELSLRKNDLNQAKKDLVLARRELDQINADVEPVRQAQDEVETYMRHVEDIVKLRKNRVDMIKTQADKHFARIEKDKQNITNFAAQISGEANSKKERERDIARTNAEIQRLERQRQDQPVDYDAESFEHRKSELGKQLRATTNRHADCEDAMKSFRQRGANLNQDNKTNRIERAKLDTQSGKQESVLLSLSHDTAKAWTWFKEHRNELHLEGEVYGPPILECSVRDPRYADAVESQLRKGDLVAITFTHPADQKLLSDQFLSKNKLGLHDIYTRTSSKPLSDYRPPVDPSGLHNMGFEGYMINYIKGPDAVLAMLCDNARLHRTAYAPRPLSDEQHAAVSSSAIQKWVSGRDIFQITTRREYGVSSTTVTQLKSARFFVDQPANSEGKRQLDEAHTRIQREAAELQEEMAKCKQEILDLRKQRDDFKQARDDLQAEQDRMRRALAEWNALPTKIKQRQDDLDRLIRDNAETSSRIRAIKASAQQASLSVAALALEYAASIYSLNVTTLKLTSSRNR
jgi:chromosome segregation ATPase